MGASMKKFMLSSAAVLGIVGTASAAELPVRAPIVAPVPLFSWTGCYIGGHVGYGKGQTSQNVSFDDVGTGGEFHPATNFDNTGVVGGVQGGCNYQWGMFVTGLEGDWSSADLKKNFNFVDPTDNGNTATDSFTSHSNINSLASIRGRFGIAADRFLVYTTMGWAWAKFNYSFAFHDHNDGDSVGSFSTTADGVVLGAGVNYALTDWLILRAEYLHYAVGKDISLTSSRLLFPPGDPLRNLGPNFGDRAGITNVDVIRVGADWKFNWWGAPVGRY
jgi:outer membrane immunogenic protein